MIPAEAYRAAYDAAARLDIAACDIDLILEAAAPYMRFDAHTAKPNNWV